MDFREKVKKVRIEIGYSQEQLARELGVSFATINRWENGKSEPRQLALNTFEPHISIPSSKYGFKKENIYYFENGKLVEL